MLIVLIFFYKQIEYITIDLTEYLLNFKSSHYRIYIVEYHIIIDSSEILWI